MNHNEHILLLKQYQDLVWEYQRIKEAYDNDLSSENWERLQESIRKLKQQDKVIELNRLSQFATLKLKNVV